MKILELRFKNLNSLYGEWVIDFTDPEYVANGIFALTGPTGAGKSTILDAVCLALYGATPRLGKITKSGNEIMSRQTGECYAEVLFESQAGRFRCHWEQRRARKKPDGNLQDQEHQITDAGTRKPIETRKSLVGRVIEEKTGMDFDRFTRSILLAQGGFDTFLKAGIEDKSKILEQITGTEIYSEISRRVHERQRDEQEKLNILNAETSGIIILEPEQEKSLLQDLDSKQKQEAGLAGKLTETGRAVAWLTAIDGLEKEIRTLADDAAKLQAEIEAFKPERIRLEQARKASSLDGAYATLTALRKQQSEDQAALKIEKSALPDLEASATKQASALKAAEQLTLNARAELRAAVPLIRKIRSLDQTLAEQAQTVSRSSENCARDAEKIEADRQTRGKEQEKRTAAEKKREAAERYLNAHAQDEWLISGLAGIEEQFASLIGRQKEITQKDSDLRNAGRAAAAAAEKRDAAARQRAVCKQALEEATKKHQLGRETLNALLGDKRLREYRAEKESLLREMAYIQRIGELVDHRSRLEDGKPCPLCGSTVHPYAAGNIPVPDEIERKIARLSARITAAEDQEAAVRKLEKAQTAAHNNLTDSEKQEADAVNAKTSADRIHAELAHGLTALVSGFEQLKLTIQEKLRPLGYGIDFTDPVSTVRHLQSKMKKWQEQVRQKSDIEKQIAAIDSEVKRLDAVIGTRNRTLAEHREKLEQLKKAQAAGKDERKKLYGSKDPDKEENRLNTAVDHAEANEKKAGILNTGLQQKLITAKTHIESLKKRMTQREPELNQAETDFRAALGPSGFSDEKQFLEARLTTDGQHALSSRAKTLDDAETEVKARQKDREMRLTAERAKKVTDQPLEKLTLQSREYEESLNELRDAIAGLKHKIGENMAARERIREKQSAIEAQKNECRRWDKLHRLIGSADGKKYRNFAQGLTFELMVTHANRQLEKMTDRYLLVRDDRQPLELNVVDNYQAGEIRSIKNLSGGESFIVSLTLALGLSKMSSRKVRVDSLFLDEGFGTLDEESLETALETLSGLQQDGKLIGIISHVSALKERLRTRITVTPVSGGRSSLSGPGCVKAGEARRHPETGN